MRGLAGAFGITCGAVIAAIVSRYGYRTADNELDGYIWAFTFGMIALGGLTAHALAVRVWRESRVLATLIGLAGLLALSINLSNSLGAMAGRSNEKQAGRLKIAETVRNARRDLTRAQSELEGLHYTPTDGAAVEAAIKARNAATSAREAECTIRGNRCRDREDDEKKAASNLASASTNKAATDRATQLEADIKRLDGVISASGPVLEANPQGSALARLFGLPETAADWLTTWQNFAMAIVAEFLIVLSLVACEVLRKQKPKVIDLEPIAEIKGAPAPIIPKAPRLVSSQSQPFGSVVAILADLMEPDCGRVEFAEAYGAYDLACKIQGRKPVDPEEFSKQLKRICREMRIDLQREGSHVYLVGVRIKKFESMSVMPIDICMS